MRILVTGATGFAGGWLAETLLAQGAGRPEAAAPRLFGLSRRAYGDASTEFLRGLKSARPAEIDALAKYPLPVVRVKD